MCLDITNYFNLPSNPIVKYENMSDNFHRSYFAPT